MKLLSTAAAVALVLAACGGASASTAATVNGTEVTVADVESLIETDGSTIPKEQFATFLGFEIQWVIIVDSVREEWGIEVTDDEIAAEADRIFESASTGEESREDFLASRGVTEEFLLHIAHQALLDQAVRAELDDTVAEPTQAEIADEMAAAAASLTQVCVSHILVPTEEEATEALDRLEGGDEFGAVASEVSQDPGSAENNGILPCSNAGQYVPEFRDASLEAPVGEVYDEIVETQFGYHVMLVTDRTEADAGSLPAEDEIAASLKADAVALALNEWFLDVVSAADVTVEEQYGTWQALPEPAVIPPSP